MVNLSSASGPGSKIICRAPDSGSSMETGISRTRRAVWVSTDTKPVYTSCTSSISPCSKRLRISCAIFRQSSMVTPSAFSGPLRSSAPWMLKYSRALRPMGSAQ